MTKEHRRTVGDTYPIKAIIKVKVDDTVNIVDITGAIGEFNFKNTAKGKITLVGVVVNGPAGEIHFTPTAAQVDSDGTYNYNLKITQDGVVTTYKKGQLILEDDL